MLCFYCGESVGVAVPGMMKGDRKAPDRAAWDDTPCDKCAGLMKDGIMLIEVDDAKSIEQKTPWRTGQMCVLKEDAIRRAVTPDTLADDIIKARVAFLPIEVWDKLGLPRGNTP